MSAWVLGQLIKAQGVIWVANPLIMQFAVFHIRNGLIILPIISNVMVGADGGKR